MSIRSKISPLVSGFVTSDKRLARNRRLEERRRLRAGQRHTVRYFHELGDPYSHLMAQLLANFVSRYDVDIVAVPVPPPPDWAAPERARLVEYSRRDAGRIATRLPAGPGASFADPGAQPDDALLERARRVLVGSIEAGSSDPATLAALDAAVWRGDADELATIAIRLGESTPDATRAALERGTALRDRLGHYLGATLHYGGEWYWGIDRLHFLEDRLYALGAYRGPEPYRPLFEPPSLELTRNCAARTDSPPLEFFVSLRSPYTYLAVERTITLADHYGLELSIRPVLPMVMRGLPVPARKRTYIALDCKREANRLGIAFGKIADPLGRPVERALAVLHHAVQAKRGTQYLASVTRGIWAEGVDVGSDRGLRELVERAGLDWSGASQALNDSWWRDEAEANRNEMLLENIWGVPAFRFGSFATWGQDRLWLLERAIIEHLGPA